MVRLPILFGHPTEAEGPGVGPKSSCAVRQPHAESWSSSGGSTQRQHGVWSRDMHRSKKHSNWHNNCTLTTFVAETRWHRAHLCIRPNLPHTYATDHDASPDQQAVNAARYTVSISIGRSQSIHEGHPTQGNLGSGHHCCHCSLPGSYRLHRMWMPCTELGPTVPAATHRPPPLL